jgi:hypothetical protein
MIIEKEDKIKPKKESKKVGFAIDDEDDHVKKDKGKVTPYLESNKNLADGEILEFDNKAYEMLHRATTEWFNYMKLGLFYLLM